MEHASALSSSAKKTSFAWRRLIQFCLACLFLFLWFGSLDERELFHPDEGRYAEIPREMVASGDWVTPRLNDLKYFEKPILQYWITATTYLAFGEEEFVARLWPAFAGFLTLLLVYYMGRRLMGVRAGIVAATVLATTFQFFLFSQILTLDMGLSFFLTLALYGLLAAQDLRTTPKQRRNGAVIMWIAMALAVLSKGLVGVVLPALVLAVYILIERDFKLLHRLHWGIGIPVLLVITLPWFVWVQLRNPEFFQFFFIREHFGRFALNEHHRAGAWYYFLAVLLVGGMPWSLVYVRALFVSWRSPPPENLAINPMRLLLLWVVSIVVFYSVSQSKLPGYILPVYPALALLLGCAVQRQKIALSRSMLLGIAGLGIAIVAAAPLIMRIPKFAANADLIEPYTSWVMASGAIMLAAALVAYAVRIRFAHLASITLSFGILLAFQVLVVGAESVEDLFSSEQLVDTALDKIGEFEPDVPFYSLDMYEQTMPHHLGRTLTVVKFKGELQMGISQDPAKAVASVEEFRGLWQAHPQAYAIMTPEQWHKEQAAGTPIKLLAVNRRAVIVARAAQNEKRPRRPDR